MKKEDMLQRVETFKQKGGTVICCDTNEEYETHLKKQLKPHTLFIREDSMGQFWNDFQKAEAALNKNDERARFYYFLKSRLG